MLFQINADRKVLDAQLDRRGTTTNWYFTTEQEEVVRYWKNVFSNSSLNSQTLVKELSQEGLDQCLGLVGKIIELHLCKITHSSASDVWIFVVALKVLYEAKYLKRIQTLERKIERLKPKKKPAAKKPSAVTKSPKPTATETKDA